MQLSFADESLDLMASLDVFEHVSDIEKTLLESYRVLRPNGSLLFTIPIDVNLDKTMRRAAIVDGKLVHYVEPEYHGDPLKAEGVLAFYTYGWDIVDIVKQAGFSDVKIHVPHDEYKGYFGYPPYFEAIK